MTVAERHEPFVAAYEQRKAGHSAAPSWLRDRRDAAMRQFASHGFPTTRLEDWRFANITPIAETEFASTGPVPTMAQVAPNVFREARPYVAVIAAGRFAPELSSHEGLPNGVWVGSLAQALVTQPDRLEAALGRLAAGDHPFTWLNTGLFEDGVFVHVPANTVVEWPIQIHVASDAASDPTVSHPRILISAGENSQVSIIESYGGPEGQTYFTNAVTEVAIAPGAASTSVTAFVK